MFCVNLENGTKKSRTLSSDRWTPTYYCAKITQSPPIKVYKDGVRLGFSSWLAHTVRYYCAALYQEYLPASSPNTQHCLVDPRPKEQCNTVSRRSVLLSRRYRRRARDRKLFLFYEYLVKVAGSAPCKPHPALLHRYADRREQHTHHVCACMWPSSLSWAQSKRTPGRVQNFTTSSRSICLVYSPTEYRVQSAEHSNNTRA